MTSALLAMDTGDLKSEGNRISCLPTDLLIVIFSTLRAMEVALKIHGRRWIVVSHVCRKWRDVALAFSNLWTHVSTSWGSIATEFIRRSGIAPLKLWILLTSSASHPEIEAVNLAIAHIFHACELHISVDDETDLLQDMWGKMRLIGCSQILTTISLRSTHKCEFPHPLFQNIPPGLRVLEMTMICLPSQPGLLRQLTRLKITSTNRCRISSGDMMDMLEFCVQLTDFDFRYFGRLGPPSSGTGIVTLPSLQRMSLALGNEVSMDFLYYLKLPADVSLVIKSRIRFPSPVLPAELYARYDSCHLTISSDTISILTSTGNAQGMMDIKYSHNFDDSPVSLGLTAFQSSFLAFLGQLENFTITVSAPPPSAHYTFIYSSPAHGQWENLFRHIPNLTCLTLDGHGGFASNGLIEPLVDTLCQPTEGPQQPFCPILRTLTLQNFSFESHLGEQESLVRSVGSRHRSNARLGMLDISKCSCIDSAMLSALAPFVDVVVKPSVPITSISYPVDDTPQYRFA